MNKKTVSVEKLEANRRNGAKSQGPVTVQGKKYSSRNALKHGVLSKEVVITEGEGKEDAEEYQKLLMAHMEDLQPVGVHEELLVKEIADCRWRLRRAKLAEVGEVRKVTDDISQRHSEEIDAQGEDIPLVKSQVQFAVWRDLRDGIRNNCVSAESEPLLDELRQESPDLAKDCEILLAQQRRPADTAPAGKQDDSDLEGARRRLLKEIEPGVKFYEEKATAAEYRDECRVTSEKAAGMVPESQILERLIRYETAITRQLYKAIHELERSRMRRAGQMVPAAAQLDVS